MKPKYWDKLSKQVVELIECNEEKRFLQICPEGEVASVILNFNPGYSAKAYLEKHFEEIKESACADTTSPSL